MSLQIKSLIIKYDRLDYIHTVEETVHETSQIQTWLKQCLYTLYICCPKNVVPFSQHLIYSGRILPENIKLQVYSMPAPNLFSTPAFHPGA